MSAIKSSIFGQKRKELPTTFLMILPFIILPLGMSAWLAMSQIAKSPAPSRQPPLAQTSQSETDDRWGLELIVLLSIGFVNLGIAAWITRRLSASIEQVTVKLTEAANGDLSAKLNPDETAEFQELAASFNQLVANFELALQQQQLAAQANKLYGKIALIAQESVDRLQVYQTSAIGMRRILAADRVSILQCHPDGTETLITSQLPLGIQRHSIPRSERCTLPSCRRNSPAINKGRA